MIASEIKSSSFTTTTQTPNLDFKNLTSETIVKESKSFLFDRTSNYSKKNMAETIVAGVYDVYDYDTHSDYEYDHDKDKRITTSYKNKYYGKSIFNKGHILDYSDFPASMFKFRKTGDVTREQLVTAARESLNLVKVVRGDNERYNFDFLSMLNLRLTGAYEVLDKIVLLCSKILSTNFQANDAGLVKAWNVLNGYLKVIYDKNGLFDSSDPFRRGGA